MYNFIWLGKIKHSSLKDALAIYQERLKHYIAYKVTILKEPKVKSKNRESHKKAEADLILSKVRRQDYVILLDERGKQLSSVQLARWIEHKQNISISSIVLIIAGPYGAHQSLKDRADYTLSLSTMTLTHDMVRVVLLEQMYRAHTIIRGESYHNE